LVCFLPSFFPFEYCFDLHANELTGQAIANIVIPLFCLKAEYPAFEKNLSWIGNKKAQTVAACAWG